MSTKRIILISGYARSGKDSLANALEKHLAHCEPVRVKFANELKTALGISTCHLGLMDVDVFTEDDAAKQALRPLLVEFGKYARCVDKDVFVNAAWNTICDLFENGKGVVIVPDLRYANEINLISERAKEREWNVVHLRIGRVGNQAANEEELQSINALPYPDASRIFVDGNIEGIEEWAKELCRQPSFPVPDWLKEGNKGAPVDPTKVTAYLQHGFSSSWHGPNGEPLFIDKTKLVFGHSHNPTPASTEEQLKALWDESLCLDETIDRVSQKVDNISDRLATQYNADEALFKKMNELNATLERIDARLKRLEEDARYDG